MLTPLPPTWAVYCRIRELALGRAVWDWAKDGWR